MNKEDLPSKVPVEGSAGAGANDAAAGPSMETKEQGSAIPSASKEEAPAPKDEAPVLKEEAPAPKNDEAPAPKNDEAPAPKDEAPKNEAPAPAAAKSRATSDETFAAIAVAVPGQAAPAPPLGASHPPPRMPAQESAIEAPLDKPATSEATSAPATETGPNSAPPSSTGEAPHQAAVGRESSHGAHGKAALMPLTLAAIGVVFGDIGTSPLYAVKECFSPASVHHVDPTPANVLGVLSLIFWSMLMVVTVKYVTFIMRADNQGAGGVLALLALVPSKPGKAVSGALIAAVLFGSALLYGDGVITPAISVLSAIEGLEVATHTLKPVVLPLTCVILIVLFLAQRHGTAIVGSIFGPMTLVWFVMIAALGVAQIIDTPSVLWALDLRHGIRFFIEHKGHGFLILGAVVLCITGGEALYADMGHFGLKPIRLAWYAVVWPALVLNYFGQGALLLKDPAAAVNPFYGLVPSWALYPAVVIASGAAVVASQALISGAFSLTQQAVQLGFFPRVTIVHTSKETEGQIYIPEVNNAMLVACIWLVLMFKTSTALAATYGIAMTATMVITNIVYFVVATRRWGWPLWKAGPLVFVFLIIDLAFFGANAAKFFGGGWFPVAMALLIFTVMSTWKTGRTILARIIQEHALPLQAFLDDVKNVRPHRVKGTAVFMASNPHGTPPVLLHHFKHNQVLHQQVVLLTIESLKVPEVPVEERVQVSELGEGFWKVTARYGFMQQPNVPNILSLCKRKGLQTASGSTSFYLGRETLLPTGHSGLSRWRKNLFAFISRNARPATSYFGLPPGRVVELGMQIDL
ncbi:MAG TPA: KUP/HAK/KT family potassium transporter [Polyangiaceae bacterium]|nr:KUP/HAK/KT family potassium transporter [Polyangiaceae bacterium]